jgi:lipoic acid synthetase
MDDARELLRLPPWLRTPAATRGAVHRVKKRLRAGGLHTVCESARCPNLGECFAAPTATFLLLGDRCARGCAFCAVGRGDAMPPDPGEPEAVAGAAREMGLRHVVLTSVTRDDLPDGGAAHFAATVRAVRAALPDAAVEVLVPDFGGSEAAVRAILDARPDVFNHNVETVPRLYPTIRPAADFARSVDLLALSKRIAPDALTKSGLMVGLGETAQEVRAVMGRLRDASCDILTIGQYLRPSRRCVPVARYVPPEEFARWEEAGRALGFSAVFAGPLVRSSYSAAEVAARARLRGETG